MKQQVTHGESDEIQEDTQQVNSEASQFSIPNEEAHSLARQCPMKINFGKSPNRYGFEDMVAYALQVAEVVDVYEPPTYMEVVTCTESTH